MGLPNEAMKEAEPAQSPLRNRFACPPTSNRKRPRNCLAESVQIPARTNKRDNATDTSSCSAVQEDSDVDEEDSSPSVVTSSVRKDSEPAQEVVHEEATTNEIPAGWAPGWILEPNW